jgi:hypothetical protein
MIIFSPFLSDETQKEVVSALAALESGSGTEARTPATLADP